MSEEQAAAAAAAAELEDASIEAMFDPSKKKKKKKPAKAREEGEETSISTISSAPVCESSTGSTGVGSAAGGVAGAVTLSGGAAELSTGGAAPAGDAAASHAGATDGVSSSATGDEPLTYDDMLARLYKTLHENNPELTERHRKKVKPPQVMRVGTTRTAWVNFKEICLGLKRSLEHVQSFYLAELGTTGSIDGMERFLIKGKYTPKTVETLLRKYIAEYVTCHMCKSLETELTKDAVSRLFFLSCKQCASQRSVAPIKAGFHATAKGERKKAREAAPG